MDAHSRLVEVAFLQPTAPAPDDPMTNGRPHDQRPADGYPMQAREPHAFALAERSDVVAGHGTDLDRRAVLAYVASLTTPTSRYTTRRRLDTAARIMSSGQLDADVFPWSRLRWEHVNALRSVLASRYAPATANATLAAVRGALRACWRVGLLDHDTFRRAADVERVQGHREPPGRDVSPAELTALVDTAGNHDRPDMAARDVAVLAALSAGLRLAETVGLDLVDLDVTPAAASVLVRGKGHKERRVALNDAQAAALADWLAVRGSAPGPLFLRFHRWTGATMDRLGRESVRQLVRRLASRAGVPVVRPHDMRRSLAGSLLDAGVDLVTVADVLGHADVRVTRGYDRRKGRAARSAMSRAFFPTRDRRT